MEKTCDVFDKLTADFPDSRIVLDEPMSRHTTFKIGGPADVFIEASYHELPLLVAYLDKINFPYTFIGRGSNILVSDEGVEGAVVRLKENAKDISFLGDTMEARAGVLLSAAAAAAADMGLSGLEFAAGIPGSVGGAVFMNAGAFGGEMSDVVAEVTVLDATGKVGKISAEALDLSYRHSILMEKPGIIVSAKLRLRLGDKDDIRHEMDDIKKRRIDRQPLDYPSAGSTFKRPEGYFAGKLIEDAGLKGFSCGGAMISEKHCGFVINAKDATCKDVMDLMRHVDAVVWEKFHVHLQPEIRIIGRNVS